MPTDASDRSGTYVNAYTAPFDVGVGGARKLVQPGESVRLSNDDAARLNTLIKGGLLKKQPTKVAGPAPVAAVAASAEPEPARDPLPSPEPKAEPRKRVVSRKKRKQD